MSVDPSQLVYEGLAEEHSDEYVGRAVVYTPEGEMVFETEVSVDGVTGFRIVFDAGDVSGEDIDQAGARFGIEDIQETDRVVPGMGFLGSGSPDGAPTERVRRYVFEGESYSFNVGLEDVGSKRQSKLVVDGVYGLIEDLEGSVAGYASELSDFEIRPFTKYMEKDEGLSPEKVADWEKETWEDIIEESFREAVQAVPVQEQR